MSSMRTLLTAAESRRLTRLLVALPFLGAVDALGLAAIIAVFLHVVGMHQIAPFHRLLSLAPALSERALGLMLLVAIAVVRFATGMLTQFLIFRFCYSVQERISAAFLDSFLATDLDYVAGKDKAFGVQIIFNECARYASGILVNGLQIAYEALTLVIYLLVVVYTNVKLSLLLIASAVVVFGLVRRLSEEATQRLGSQRLRLDGRRLSYINEAFQGFQEIGAYGLAGGFVAKYEQASAQSLRATLWQQLLNLLPKNIFELLLVVGLLVAAFATRGPISQNAVATIAILMGAAFRCMPSINRILSSRQLMSFEMPVVRELSGLWQESAAARRNAEAAPGRARTAEPARAAMAGAQAVRVPPVRFSRPGHRAEFELDVDALELEPTDLVLIMGETGCGKSTYLGCVAGLLTRGRRFEGPPRTPPLSYAPQTAFILNDTLEGNISLAQFFPGRAVDRRRLLEAARVAQLLEGERPIIPFEQVLQGSGSTLSGGQRQRIALARALYFESQLLILDEATSGLDEATEKAFLEAYRASGLRRATLFVTHRTHLASAATRVYRLENGTLTQPEPCNEYVQ